MITTFLLTDLLLRISELIEILKKDGIILEENGKLKIIKEVEICATQNDIHKDRDCEKRYIL